MEIQELKSLIKDSIKIAQEKGYTLISNEPGNDDDKCACALQCVVLAKFGSLNSIDITENLLKITNISPNAILSFIEGYDGGDFSLVEEENQKYFKLGQDIYIEYQPDNKLNRKYH